jgi:hypothetical protein
MDVLLHVLFACIVQYINVKKRIYFVLHCLRTPVSPKRRGGMYLGRPKYIVKKKEYVKFSLLSLVRNVIVQVQYLISSVSDKFVI